MIDPKVKEFVENANYCSMLQKQRFCPIGDSFFQMNDETWDYWKEQFNIKRSETGDNGVLDSKALG